MLVKRIFLFCFFSILTVSFSYAQDGNEKSVYLISFNHEFIQHSEHAISEYCDLNDSEFESIYYSQPASDSFIMVDLTLREYTELKKLESIGYIHWIEKDDEHHIEATWGQDRINQKSLPLDGHFDLSHYGHGVNIYIVDTGIRRTHTEFSGRVGSAISMASDSPDDCVGHGTHVAGIAAGASRGIASQATVHSIRINHKCDFYGTAKTSNILKAFRWIRDNAEPNSIVNFSYTAEKRSILNEIDRTIAEGHVVITSSGNDGKDICKKIHKPVAAVVVGSTTTSDFRASDSNYGKCIDIFAPGTGISSADYAANNTFRTESGTSMASAFVAGIAATYREKYPSATNYEVTEALVENAALNKVKDAKGSKNRLLQASLKRPDTFWRETGQTFLDNRGVVHLPPVGCEKGDHIAVTIDSFFPPYFYYMGMVCD